MVKLFGLLLKSSKGKRFLDQLRVHVRGGTGGEGLERFGGRGGQGGNVFVVAKEKTLLKQIFSKYPEKRIAAETGKSSSQLALLGAAGEDVEVAVPTGVIVRTDEDKVIGELNTKGDRLLVAAGGQGGYTKNKFKGQKGQAHSVTFDLKLIADIGLVGFPNAGKSTFLKAISRATPKIASYPFTTIQPQLGTMQYEDLRQISVADLPGLIEGAHVNVGMGHKFLKHVERTKLLLFVVDLFGFRLGVKHIHRTAFETIQLLVQELELFKQDLLDKPAILALNKSDMPGSDEKLEEVMAQLHNLQGEEEDASEEDGINRHIKFHDIVVMSAKEQEGTEELKQKLRETLDFYADLEYNKQRNFEQRQKQYQEMLETDRGLPTGEYIV